MDKKSTDIETDEVPVTLDNIVPRYVAHVKQLNEVLAVIYAKLDRLEKRNTCVVSAQTVYVNGSHENVNERPTDLLEAVERVQTRIDNLDMRVQNIQSDEGNNKQQQGQ